MSGLSVLWREFCVPDTGCLIRKSKTCNVDFIIKDRVHIIGQQDRITDKTERRKKIIGGIKNV